MTGPLTADAAPRSSLAQEPGLVAVCALDQIDPETGVAVLVEDVAVAVFRTRRDQVYALGNYDPVGRASVLSRGIVGTRTVEGEEVPFVASPLYKQAFDLRTGACLDEEGVRVSSYRVVVRHGQVMVGVAVEPG